MADTQTANIQITNQTIGGNSNTWGNVLNANNTTIDNKFGTQTAISTTGGTTTLLAAQEIVGIIDVSGVLVSNATIVFSGRGGFWIVNNRTTGSFSVTCKVSGQTGVVVAQGAVVLVYCNGTDIVATVTTGGLLAANNLSDLASAATARTNLGVGIGVNVQAYDADLATWAGLTPSANAQSLVTAADYAAMRILLGLVIGTNVQAYDADLSTWAGLTPSANFQTLVTETFAQMRTSLSLAYAAQSDQETGTSTTVVVAPGTQKYHPAHPKAQGRFNSAGTLIGTSFGVTSVVHSGTGVFTVTLSTAMADTNYGVNATVNQAVGGSSHIEVAISSTTIFVITMRDQSNNGTDLSCQFTVFGDQP